MGDGQGAADSKVAWWVSVVYAVVCVASGVEGKGEAMLTAENVDHRDGKDNTCLHHACMQGKKRVAKMLLRLGADINAQNRRGHTCLHYCFAYGYEELGEYLITKGADESILNEMGATCREVESGSVTSRGEAA